MRKQCTWPKKDIEIKYHNEEWCKVNHNDDKQFELLILEGMQAGLSWLCVLNKREDMRKAFYGFDYHKCAKLTEKQIDKMMQNEKIIRNRRKLEALRTNAKCFMEVQKEWGSFDKYIWHFTNNKQIDHKIKNEKDTPSQDELSDEISSDLKKKGFKFVGTKIIYSYLQAIGVINDHIITCDYHNR